MDDPLIVIAALAFLVEVVIATWCAWDLRRTYHHLLPESVLWKHVADSNIRTVLAGSIIGVVAIYSLIREVFGWPAIARPWGSVLVLFALVLLMASPIFDWWTFRRIRQSR